MQSPKKVVQCHLPPLPRVSRTSFNLPVVTDRLPPPCLKDSGEAPLAHASDGFLGGGHRVVEVGLEGLLDGEPPGARAPPPHPGRRRGPPELRLRCVQISRTGEQKTPDRGTVAGVRGGMGNGLPRPHKNVQRKNKKMCKNVGGKCAAPPPSWSARQRICR